MSVSKRSVSLDDAVAKRVEQAASDEGVSFSTWLSAAAHDKLRLHDAMHGIAEWEADAGELTPEERAARQALLERLIWRPGRQISVTAGLTYDTGALIAAERNDRLLWALRRAAVERGLLPTVPAGVLAEAWRGGLQHQMSRLLKGCMIEGLDEQQARRVGVLVARSGLADTVDVAVVEGALRRDDAIVTSNRTHLEQVADSMARPLVIHDL
ncbi:MAG: hypothetical protein ACK5OX_03655 [Desertimonas sp.]